ncbi:regulator SirB [Marinihelvus fidelis]|uniref:Regulator SirB n=1 Tax=Marinihelvus fidelis TaxID=2613842 RepID=A0A5N0TBI1_9GAMM|nr:SirB2 family protein [Marinihelvus fidelis]KAA9131437.1 regulator SirB [Marinihelvus fidelis]
MAEFYLQIRWVHIIAVLASGSLFFLRGILVLGGKPRLAMTAPVRYLSYTIDTALLTAALMLMTILRQYPFVQGWLTVKVLLLVVYIVLGSIALKRGQSRKTRAVAFAVALVVYGFIISVARAHNPAGWFIS